MIIPGVWLVPAGHPAGLGWAVPERAFPCPGKGARGDLSPTRSTDQTLLPAPALPDNPSLSLQRGVGSLVLWEGRLLSSVRGAGLGQGAG